MMLNELQIKKLFKRALEKYIKSLNSSSLYFASHEAECKAYMRVLNDKQMIDKYEFLHIDNSKHLLKELDEYIQEYDRVSKAIKNIFKEVGREVRTITDSSILTVSETDQYGYESYFYEVDEVNDVIYIKNDDDKLVFEKFIQSYQNSFSFTINK